PGPEIGQVTFEQSTDGTNYVLLGSATRISGAWQLAGITLPTRPTFWLRATGRASGGEDNGSSGLIESVSYLPRPLYLANVTRLGRGAFQFAWSDPDNLNFTVLAATNMPSSNWTVLGPATRVGSAYQMTDLDATNYPRRFYKLRWP